MRVSFILVLIMCITVFANGFIDDKAEALRIIQIVMPVGVILAILIELKLRKDRESLEKRLAEAEEKLRSLHQASDAPSNEAAK